MRLTDDYLAQAMRDARRFQGAWTGTSGTLAAHTHRLITERQELVATISELERQNAELRAAVEKRLESAAGVPEEIAAAFPNMRFVPAEPQKPAEFVPTCVQASLPPDQLQAAWQAIADRAKAAQEKREPIEVSMVEAKPRLRLIGIAGRAGAGKNTVASMVPGAVVVQLADPLYAALAVMLGVPETTLRLRTFKEREIPGIGKTPRQLLQTLGTEWGRTLVREDVWLVMLERRLTQLAAAGVDTVVVADVRFENEADWIRDQGGEVWHVVRETAADGHASERGISIADGDRVIDNTRTLDDLRAFFGA